MRRHNLIIGGSIFLFAGCTQQIALVSQPESTLVAEHSAAPTPTLFPVPSPTPNATHTLAKPSTRPTSTPSQRSQSISIAQLPSEFKSDDARDVKTVDTIVIHTLYNPAYPQELTITRAKQVLDESQVSSHYVIDRDGKVYQLVPENFQAWQAGESKMPAPDNRTGVNKFSIGIELIATETSGITTAQYTSLTSLVTQIAERLPIKTVLGHSDIAPGRKTDPWKFDWSTWQASLQRATTHVFRFAH